LRTHAHGQGYTDLNGVLPEMLAGVDYTKGVHTAANGDLSAAGSADFRLIKQLHNDFASVEFGEYGYLRGVLGTTLDLNQSKVIKWLSGGREAKPDADPSYLTYIREYNSYDGPFELDEDFSRIATMGRWFKGTEANHFALTYMGYLGDWRSSDQIPLRAINSGRISRFSTLDQTTGGESARYSLNAAWKTTQDDVVTQTNVYAIYYDLDLYSNFTYFLDDPVNGDQFNQRESRWILGGNWSRSWTEQHLLGHAASYTVGLQTRHDLIDDIGLYKTRRRQRLSTVREDDVYEGNVSAFAEATVKWTSWFRTVTGVRGDVFSFQTQRSSIAANEGGDVSGMVSPKISAIFGPWHDTEIYLNYGMGFHSNDARGVNTTIDPTTGERVAAVDPLVRIHGAEIGLRSNLSSTLTATVAGFWQRSDSELVYVGDAGTNEAGPGSQRYGVELATYWRPNDWFTLDAELALTRARFRDAPGADFIPNSIPWMFSGGATFGASAGEQGFFASLRARAFDQRPLEETGRVQGKNSFLLNASIGYRFKNWETALECLNLFDRDNNDIEYFYTSRLDGEPAAGRDDIHLHPNEPRMFRARVTYRF
jgi:hypothetical protein